MQSGVEEDTVKGLKYGATSHTLQKLQARRPAPALQHPPHPLPRDQLSCTCLSALLFRGVTLVLGSPTPAKGLPCAIQSSKQDCAPSSP